MITVEFTKDELDLLEMILLSELDTQRYEEHGEDPDTVKLYEKIKEHNNG